MTGEPYAGKPPVRFGGRGGPKGPFLPLSGVEPPWVMPAVINNLRP